MDRQTREELNSLSKEAFGSSSRWQKLVNNGFAEPHEREREVMVPRNGSVIKKVFKDRKSILKRYSVDEIRKVMTEILEARKAAAAAIEAIKPSNDPVNSEEVGKLNFHKNP